MFFHNWIQIFLVANLLLNIQIVNLYLRFQIEFKTWEQNQTWKMKMNNVYWVGFIFSLNQVHVKQSSERVFVNTLPERSQKHRVSSEKSSKHTRLNIELWELKGLI